MIYINFCNFCFGPKWPKSYNKKTTLFLPKIALKLQTHWLWQKSQNISTSKCSPTFYFFTLSMKVLVQKVKTLDQRGKECVGDCEVLFTCTVSDKRQNSLKQCAKENDQTLSRFSLIHMDLIHRLISRDRATKTGRLCLCSPFFYVAALNVRIWRVVDGR